MELQRSFRSVTEALDSINEEEVTAFLSRLVLILANELNNADLFEEAVERALKPVQAQETAQ